GTTVEVRVVGERLRRVTPRSWPRLAQVEPSFSVRHSTQNREAWLQASRDPTRLAWAQGHSAAGVAKGLSASAGLFDKLDFNSAAATQRLGQGGGGFTPACPTNLR